MVDYTIVNGISDGLGGAQLAPSGTATREQAVIMANRFCSEFEKLSPNKSEVVITKPNTTVSTPNNLWNTPSTIIPDDKMTFVYGLGGSKYTSAEEAEAHMVEIAVPVWRLQSDGTKTTGTAYLQVNASLAAIYKAIFEEIYNGDEKFPINDVGCYSWRTGEHSQGTAVDINPNENMEATINADGSLTPTCGTHWTPYTDPFSHSRGRRRLQRLHQVRLRLGRQRLAQQARLHALQLLRQIKEFRKDCFMQSFLFAGKSAWPEGRALITNQFTIFVHSYYSGFCRSVKKSTGIQTW